MKQQYFDQRPEHLLADEASVRTPPPESVAAAGLMKNHSEKNCHQYQKQLLAFEAPVAAWDSSIVPTLFHQNRNRLLQNKTKLPQQMCLGLSEKIPQVFDVQMQHRPVLDVVVRKLPPVPELMLAKMQILNGCGNTNPLGNATTQLFNL